MSINSKTEGDILIAYFTDGRILDEAKIQQIGSGLMDLIPQCTSKRMLLNFANVSFMSSAMIGKIILVNKKCKEAGIDLRLCEISDGIMEIFKMMKLQKVLNIQKDEAKAIASFDKKGLFG